MNALIKQADAVKVVEQMLGDVADKVVREINCLTGYVPSADRPTGKWIVKQGNYCGVELKEFYCDQCMTHGALRRVFSDPEPLPNYCSNCGADMRGGVE